MPARNAMRGEGAKKTKAHCFARPFPPAPADDPMGGVTDERVAYLSRRPDHLDSPELI